MVEDQLIDYLIGSTESPDSVISTEFNPSRFLVGAMREFEDLADDADGVQLFLRTTTAQANPKWLRDTYFVNIQCIGEGPHKYEEAFSFIYEVFHTLLGSDTLYLGDRAYVQFNSEDLPRFAYYLDNSKPVFVANINFVVEGLQDEFNRKALC